MDGNPRFPVGCIHHATHLKQSPPLDGEEYREFLRGEPTPSSTSAAGRTSRPPDARVVAEDEHRRPVVVFHRFGKGATLYFGSFPIPRDPFGAEGLAALAADFASPAGAEAPAVVDGRAGRAVEARLLEGPGARHLLVALNAEPEPQELTIRIPGRRLGSAVDMESDREHEMGQGPDGARLTVRLDAGDARAFKVEEIR